MDKVELEKLCDQGDSTYTIAEKTGKGQTTVRYWLNKYGLTTKQQKRRRSGAPKGYIIWAERREKDCLFCGKKIPNRNKCYCNNKCKALKERRDYIREWKLHLVSGNMGKKSTNLSFHVRNYLIAESNGICSVCGYSKKHKITGNYILAIDHIDGDHTNSRPENLRVLCPNCHAETENYGSLNPTGRGRRVARNKHREEVRVDK